MFANSNPSVPGVKYTRTKSSSIHEAMRGGHQIIEIFIPSYQISFNSGDVFRATEPENKEPLYFRSKETIEHPLTDVQLSNVLVKQILKSLMLKEQLELATNTFIANQELQNLLSVSFEPPLAMTSSAAASDAATVRGLKYTRTVNLDIHHAMHGGDKITEIFIPSNNFSFNYKAAFRTSKPYNKEAIDYGSKELIEHPLTEVQVPAILVEQLLKSVELREQLALTNKFLNTNPEYCKMLSLKIQPQSSSSDDKSDNDRVEEKSELLHHAHVDVPFVEEDTVPAYKYQAKAMDERFNTYSVIEYSVPSHNVCFNEFYQAFPPSQPVTLSNIPTDHTIIQISRSLVEKIVKQSDLKRQLEQVKEELHSLPEYKNLVKRIKPNTSNTIVAEEKIIPARVNPQPRQFSILSLFSCCRVKRSIPAVEQIQSAPPIHNQLR